MISTSTSAVVPALIRHLEDQNQYRVLDLLQIMGNEGYSDSDIKDAIALLLHENRIELTPDRQLRSTAVAA
jgi:secreted trypsin-like serine protease